MKPKLLAPPLHRIVIRQEESMVLAAATSNGMTPPASKRQKIQVTSKIARGSDSQSLLPLPPPRYVEDGTPTDPSNFMAILQHPLGLKPWGNAYTATLNLRDSSTGPFAVFSDELILDLLGYLDAEGLVTLGSTCKGLYAFSHHDELWKSLLLGSPKSRFPLTWRGSWRRTFLSLAPTQEVRILVPEFYSDALHRPFQMSQVPLAPFSSNIPPQNAILRIPEMTAAEFNSTYSTTPFILTSPVKSWPGYKEWTIASLVSKYGNVCFRAESVEWRLSDYYDYMKDQNDESPLYLFDHAFVEKMGGEIEKGFTAPACFGKDYFEVLGDERPDRRWVILGPQRSGSTFHKDPNATSAWNAVIEGEKYWVMFPPRSPPPGVYESEDHSEVTSPLSIGEWLVGFHREARTTGGCKEGICRAGEILYVPSGWWHLVVNLSPSLALTQNFIPSTQLTAVIEFLRDQAGSVSGFDTRKVEDPYKLFMQRMEEQYPKELEDAMQALERKKRKKWDSLVGASEGSGKFTFGFGDEDDSADE